jgi:hypothetical protein
MLLNLLVFFYIPAMATATALVRSLIVRVYIPILILRIPSDMDALNIYKVNIATIFTLVMSIQIIGVGRHTT